MRETVNTCEKPQAKPREWRRITAFIALCLLVMTGAAIGLKMLKTKEATHQEAVRLAQRKDELIDNHVRITDDFTRPRIYAHKIFKEMRKGVEQIKVGQKIELKAVIYYINVSEKGFLQLPLHNSLDRHSGPLRIRSFKILANDEMYELTDFYEVSHYKICDMLNELTLQKYPNLLSFRVRINNEPASDFALESEELKALKETLELSEILKKLNPDDLKTRK